MTYLACLHNYSCLWHKSQILPPQLGARLAAFQTSSAMIRHQSFSVSELHLHELVKLGSMFPI